MDATPDERLLADYLSGDEASFELLVRRHAPELHQFVLRFTGDSMTAEDVVQDTFLQVHTSADTFDAQRRFKPWLFTIAANKARDQLRRRTRRHELPFDAHVGGADESGRRFVDLLAEDRPATLDELSLEERRTAVRQSVDAMSPKLREVLVLAYYHRFPYKEIAEILGIPVGTVKSRLHAAVAAFKTSYEQAVEQSRLPEP